MERVVNAYTISPDEIQPGDVMIFVVKAMVVRPGVYRLYRCLYDSDVVPQGSRMLEEETICKELFPSLALVAEPDIF